MPSNTAQRLKEEAQKLVDAAEDNFKHQNLQKALRLALMAKQRDPQFDGVRKFIAAYEVHVAAMQKGSKGVVDFYAVIGISDTQADAKTIKKSYNKLALMVHPDKNCSAAAEGAFKHISKAWDVLSEPSKRELYDLQWGPWPSRGSRKGPQKSSNRGASRTPRNETTGTEASSTAASDSQNSTAASDSHNACAADPGIPTIMAALCPYCNSHRIYRCADGVSIKCKDCIFPLRL